MPARRLAAITAITLAVLAHTTAGPAAARPALLPPLVLPMAAPLIRADIAGQAVTLRVDPGVDTDMVILGAAAAARLGLASDTRADGNRPERGLRSVQIGQTLAKVPWSREQVRYQGIVRKLQIMQPADGDFGGADGAVSPALLPHLLVQLELRPATAADRTVTLPATTRGLLFADTIQADWPLPGGRLEIEFHPHRPTSVASVAAAALLADTGGGRITGPVHRVPIAFGVARPVRTLVLDRPLAIAGAPLARLDVRVFDWTGAARLPPDADAGEPAEAVVTGSRGRQMGWPILKLGRDALAGCASISWQPQGKRISLTCPAAAAETHNAPRQ